MKPLRATLLAMLCLLLVSGCATYNPFPDNVTRTLESPMLVNGHEAHPAGPQDYGYLFSGVLQILANQK